MIHSSRFAAQLAHPRGLVGRALGQAMDLANDRPLRLAIEALEPKTGERILDAGCGTGAALRAIRKQADCALYGLDRSKAMIAASRRRLGSEIDLAQRAIEDLPCGWPPFDAVLALNVLYFADREGQDGLRAPSALRPGGRLVAYVSDRQTMESWAFTRAGYHRLFDAHELEDLLVRSGFARTSISIKDHAVTRGIRGLIAHAER